MSTRNALVVEDMDIWQEALSEVLADAGYQVYLAPSYSEALDKLTTQEIHLAVIDPVLDDTNRHNRDGLRVLERILCDYPKIHAVVTTSSDPNRIRREVEAISAHIPILWKEEWDDNRFLTTLDKLFSQEEA